MKTLFRFEIYTQDGTLHSICVAPAAHAAKRKAWAIGAEGNLKARKVA